MRRQQRLRCRSSFELTLDFQPMEKIQENLNPENNDFEALVILSSFLKGPGRTEPTGGSTLLKLKRTPNI